MLRRAVWLLFSAFAALAIFTTLRSAAFIGQTFPGFLLSPNGMVSAFGSDDWTGVRAGLAPWDVVRAVDEQPVGRAAEILAEVRRHPPGTVFRYRVRRRDQTLEVPVESMTFRRSDFLAESLPFLVTGVAFAAAGLFIYVAQPAWTTFGFAAFGFAMGAALLRADFVTDAGGSLVLQFLLPLVAAALLHLALVFPERPAWLRRRPRLLFVPYGLSLALGAARASWLFRAPEAWARLDQIAFAYAGVAIVVLIALVAHAAARAPEPATRERARVLLWGLVPATLASAGGMVAYQASGSRVAISVVPLLGAWLWIGALAYAAVKRNVFDFEIVVRRALTVGLVSAVLLGVYALALGLSWAWLRAIGYSSLAALPFLSVVIAIPLVPGLVPALGRVVEARLFPLRVRLVQIVGRLSEELSTLMEATAVARRVEETFRWDVGVRPVTVLTARDGALDASDGVSSPPQDALAGLLPRMAAGEALSLFERPNGGGEAVRAWMRDRGFTLCLPLVARGRLEGCLALGEAPEGHVFNSEDVDTLAALGSRVAISLANARIYERLQALEARRRSENRALREALEHHPGLPEIVGRSAALLDVFRRIEQVAPTDATVLILGETGTGKELVARAIHVRSRRSDGPLVKVNCAAIPATLIESELFGHERGAFTDASARRRGKFELASQGTLFLDEIGEIPIEVQAKLLRVLQEREFERVGGQETLRADVRVIAASNRDLRTEVAERRFREDLFFRLDVFPIGLPPLRERVEDLPLLVRHFLRQFNAKLDKSAGDLAPESWREIERYAWPGNVRELENVLERAMVMSSEDVLVLPPLEAGSSPLAAPPGRFRPLAEIVRQAKVTALSRALASAPSQAQAARQLGLKPPSLSRMLRDLGMRS